MLTSPLSSLSLSVLQATDICGVPPNPRLVVCSQGLSSALSALVRLGQVPGHLWTLVLQLALPLTLRLEPLGQGSPQPQVPTGLQELPVAR